jgi:hypothetical protein
MQTSIGRSATRVVQMCFIVLVAWLASCSSSDATGPGSSAGGSGGGSGVGGSTGESCATSECFAPFRCVHECGGPVMVNGCCGCAPPLIDVESCGRDAASGDGENAPTEASADAVVGLGD